MLEIILKDTNPSHIVVKGEGNTYKSITVQAATDGTSNYTTSYTVHNTLKLSSISTEQAGPIKAINDGNVSILYATATGDISYEDNGLLYNGSVTETGGKFSINAGSTVAIAIANPRLVDGVQNIKAVDTGFAAAKSGTGIYATDNGYKEVVIDVKSDTNTYNAQVTDVPSFQLPTSVVSATVLSAPASIKLDGTVVYGGKTDDKDKSIVISTIDGDGKVTLYEGDIVETAGVLSYNLEAITSTISTALGWNTTMPYTSTISDSSVARIHGDNVYFLRKGEVTITFTSTKTGLTKQITYNVKDDYTIEKTVGKDVIYYTLDTQSVNGKDVLSLTFDLAINDDTSHYYTAISGTTGVAMRNEKTAEITVASNSNYTLSFHVDLPEYDGQARKAMTVEIDPVSLNATLASDTITFTQK